MGNHKCCYGEYDVITAASSDWSTTGISMATQDPSLVSLVFKDVHVSVCHIHSTTPSILTCTHTHTHTHYPQPTLSTFHTHHSVVFLDSTGLLNLISHLSLSHYMWLRHETSLSLQCLNTPASDGFKALFMTPVHFEMKFDLLIQYVDHACTVSCIYTCTCIIMCTANSHCSSFQG